VTSVVATSSSRSTLPNGSATTVIVSFSSRITVTETRNKIGDPTTVSPAGANTNSANTGASQTGASNTNNNGSGGAAAGGGGGAGISAGAIAGIVIGALAVLAIFTLAFVLYRRKKPSTNNTTVGGESPAPKYEPTPQMGQDMTNYPIPVTPGSSTAVMASSHSGYSGPGNVGGHASSPPPPAASEPSWGTRAELGGGGR